MNNITISLLLLIAILLIIIFFSIRATNAWKHLYNRTEKESWITSDRMHKLSEKNKKLEDYIEKFIYRTGYFVHYLGGSIHDGKLSFTIDGYDPIAKDIIHSFGSMLIGVKMRKCDYPMLITNEMLEKFRFKDQFSWLVGKDICIIFSICDDLVYGYSLEDIEKKRFKVK